MTKKLKCPECTRMIDKNEISEIDFACPYCDYNLSKKYPKEKKSWEKAYSVKIMFHPKYYDMLDIATAEIKNATKEFKIVNYLMKRFDITKPEAKQIIIETKNELII